MQYNNVFIDWLHRRKITDNVITEFNIHAGSHPILGECIVIPIYTSHGEFSFNKYRRNPMSEEKPKYVYDKGGHLTLYGAHRIKEHKSVLITEGEMDSLVAWSSNIPAVSGTGGALSFDTSWFDILLDKEVTICFDNDPAGGEGMAKVLDIIPHARILFLPERAGVKDISDYVQNGGDLGTLIKTAKRFQNIEDIIEDRAERLSLWKSTYFHDAYIHNHKKPEPTEERPRSALDGMERAKEFPIDKLIDFNQSKARCIWHSEKSASLTYYKQDNRVYCFGCAKSGDSIDVYRQIYNVSMKDAIKNLQ